MERTPASPKKAKSSSKDFDKQVAAKVEEMLVNAAAMEAIGREEPTYNAYILQKMYDELAAARGRTQAARLQSEARRKASEETAHTYPWGLHYLEEDAARARSAKDIHEGRLGHSAHIEELRVAEADRDTVLAEKQREARHFTLGLAQEVAERLRAEGIEADTEVFRNHSQKARKAVGLGKIIFEGKFSETVEQSNPVSFQKGWLLTIGGRQQPYATAVLCEDGRILTGYGTTIKDGEKTRFTFEQGGAYNPKVNPDYWTRNVGFLDESYESDVTAPSLTEGNPLTAARVAFDREEAMQVALVDLLVDYEVAPE